MTNSGKEFLLSCAFGSAKDEPRKVFPSTGEYCVECGSEIPSQEERDDINAGCSDKCWCDNMDEADPGPGSEKREGR